MLLSELLVIFRDAGFGLGAQAIEFLEGLEERDSTAIDKIHALFSKYANNEGILLYRHGDFLFNLFHRASILPPNMQENIAAFLLLYPMNYSEIIVRLYDELWPDIAMQANTLILSYHNGFHGLEVAMRTAILAKLVGLFLNEDATSQFLHFLLLIAATYHDYIQWEKGRRPEDDSFRTAEEETAHKIANIMMRELGLEDTHSSPHNDVEAPLRESVTQLVQLFFPLMIGTGTTLLFGRQKLISLSTIYYELAGSISSSRLIEDATNVELLRSLGVAMEVMSIADKAGYTCHVIVQDEYHYPEIRVMTRIRECLGLNEHSRMMTFLRTLSPEEYYYPDCSLDFNLQAAAMIKVPQIEMELELHRGSPEAQRLRSLIKKGQQLYRDEPTTLLEFLYSIFIDETIYRDFQQIYLANVEIEVEFYKKISGVCRDAQDRLYQLGCLDDLGVPCYKPFDAISDETFPLQPLIDATVAVKESEMLPRLADYMRRLEKEEFQKMIQEMLVYCMTQPGIFYTNHPFCIAKIEPQSPLGYYSPKPEDRSLSFAGTRYASFQASCKASPVKVELISEQRHENTSVGEVNEVYDFSSVDDGLLTTEGNPGFS